MLFRSKNLAIYYGRDITNETTGLQPTGFYDTDFIGDLQSSKSTFGYLFKLTGGAINWKSKKASTITLSTLKAETDALTKGIREVQWLKSLFKELQRPILGPLTLKSDN